MTPEAEHFRKLERMYASAPVNEYFRPTLEIAQGTAEVSLVVRPDFHHAARAVHGSIYFKLLDDAAFFAANSLVEDVFVLTSSFTLYLLRPVEQGRLLARGQVVNHSRRQLVADAVLEDEQGRQIARGSGVFMPGRTPLSADVGYR